MFTRRVGGLPFRQGGRAVSELQLCSIRDIAKLMAIDVRTVYRRVAEKDFPRPMKLGHSSRWLVSEVAAYLERKKRERGQ